MADFNKILTPGDYENGEINVVVEIPTGSNHKIEWDRKNACFMLDRIEPIAFAKPTNYGFIPQTLDEGGEIDAVLGIPRIFVELAVEQITALDEDGDELDVLLITDQPLTTGIYTVARVLGVMKFVDDGEVDDKIIAVPADDRNNGDQYKTLEDLPKRLIEQINFHFNHYKDLKKPGSTVVKGFFGVDEAKAVIKDAITRWNEQ
jgi:inorganic pyrophosphatase